MAKVMGVEKLVAQLQAKAAAAKKDSDVSAAVGYTASYALAVHEKVAMKLRGLPRGGRHRGFYWDPLGRAKAKFLTDPFRRLSKELQEIVVKELLAGRTMAQALLVAGLRLQRESQLEVPVDTSFLKSSAFTRLEVPAKRG